MGNRIGGRGKRLTKGSGVRTQFDVERDRGRKLINLRQQIDLYAIPFPMSFSHERGFYKTRLIACFLRPSHVLTGQTGTVVFDGYWNGLAGANG